MGNSLKTEQKFFSFLQKHYSKEDFIKLDYGLIPNGASNKLSRYYSGNTSIWFSRLKLNHKSIIYYFGSMEDEKLGEKSKIFPRVIMHFDESNTKSSIRFYKGNFLVLIKTPRSGEAYHKLKNHPLKIMHGSADKSLDKFYVELGELNSNKLIKNLDFFVKNFNFEIDLRSIIISISGILKNEVPEDSEISKPAPENDGYLEHFKFNLKAIEIKNNINKCNISFNGKKKVNSGIFKENIDGDYYFNEKFKDEFNISDEDLLIKLSNCIINLKKESDYNVLFEKILYAIKENSEIASSIINNSDEDLEVEEEKDGDAASSTDEKVDVEEDKDGTADVTSFIDEEVDVGEDKDGAADVASPTEETIGEDVGVFDDESEFTTDLDSDSIKEILLKIDLNSSNFTLKGNTYEKEIKIKLISDLNDFTSNMMFKFNTKSLNDKERACLVKKIELDILEDEIYGEIKSIVSYYVDQYKFIKTKFLAYKCLKFYIKSKSFDKLVSEYDYDENIVKSIIDKVKEDIENNNLEYSDVETKFEIYFRSFESNKKYYEKLESYRNEIKVYEIQYNLTKDELNSIFDNIEAQIDNNNGSMDIDYLIEKEIENLILDIKSDTCNYVNNLSLSDLMEKLKLAEEACEKVKRKTFTLIYEDNLRIYEITDGFLLDVSTEMIEKGIIDEDDIIDD